MPVEVPADEIQASLNYYSQWLVKSVHTYPQDIWSDVWQRHDSPVYRHYHCMHYLLPDLIGRLRTYDSDVLFRNEFFEERVSKAVGHTFIQVKPVAQFEDDVSLRYNVGTRSNGVDAAKWPSDLGVEIVA